MNASGMNRRGALKLSAAGAALAVGPAVAAANVQQGDGQEDEGGGEAALLATFRREEIVCKNVLGRGACLFLIEQNDKFFLEVSYRGLSKRIKLSNASLTLFSVAGVSLKITVSDVNISNSLVSFRVKLVADLFLGDVTIINQRVRIPLRFSALALQEAGLAGLSQFRDEQPGAFAAGEGGEPAELVVILSDLDDDEE